jgi:autotransporter-associated beta strand protein
MELRHLRRNRVAQLCGILCASIAGWTSNATAAEAIWIGQRSSVWSDPENWLGGIVPPVGGANDLTLRFTAPIGAFSPTANDLGTPFTVNKVVVEREDTFTSQLGGTLRFSGVAPELRTENLGLVQLTGPLTFAPGTAEVTIKGSGWGDVQLATIAQDQGTPGRLIVDASAPTIDSHRIRLTQNVVLTNGVTLRSGNLQLAGQLSFSQRALGQGALVVEGGTLQFSRSMTVPNAVDLKANLVIAQGGGSTMSGVISSSTPGAGLTLERISSASGLQLDNAENLTLTGVSTYDGPTIVRRGLALSGTGGAGITRLFLSGAGSLLNSSRYEVGAESLFEVVGTNTGNNRLNDTAPVQLRGGHLSFSGNIPSERLGAISVSGFGRISLSLPFGTSPTISISAPSLDRSDRGTLSLFGTNLGGASGAATRLLLDTAPALVGGGGSGTDRSIVPFAVSHGLLTYQEGIGLRPLTSTEYASTIGGSGGRDNVLLTTSTHNNEARSVNALLLSAAITGAGTISIASGTVMSGQSAVISNNLEFGTAEANFFTPWDLTVSGVISGSNGLTKSDLGTLKLTGANTFTGPLTINAGPIEFTSPAALGAETSAITLGATSISSTGRVSVLQWSGEGTVEIARDLKVLNGFGGLRVTSGGQDRHLIYSGTISGEGGLQLSGGKVTLSGHNTYSGGTQVGGEMVIASDAALGAGTLDLRGGTLTLQQNWQPTRNIIVTGGTVNTAGFNAELGGWLSGAGALTKQGDGALRISTAQPYSGALTIAGGALQLSGAGSLTGVATTRIQTGGTLDLDNSTAISNRIRGMVTLDGGHLMLRGNEAADAVQSLTSLALSPRSGGSSVVLASSGFGVTLSAGTLALNGGDLLVRGVGLGDRERLRFSSAPADAGGGLLNGVFTASAGSTAADSFAVYDRSTDARGEVGVRPLRSSEMTAAAVVQNPSNGGTVGTAANLLITSPAAASGEKNSINSVTIAEGGRLALGAQQTVSIASGLILVRGGTENAGLSGGTIDFGNSTGVIYTGADLDFASAALSRGGLRKTGPAALNLTGSLSIAGSLIVNEGRLRAGGSNLERVVVTPESAGIFDLQNAATAVGALEGAGRVDLGTGTLTVGSLGRDMRFAGTISGSGSVVISGGGNPNAVRELAGVSTFSGPLVLNSGRLTLSTAGAGGSGALTVSGGALYKAGGDLLRDTQTIAQPVIINGTLGVEGTGITILGPQAPVSGPGHLEMRAATGLTIQSAAGHFGETRIASALRVTSPLGDPLNVLKLSGAYGALTNTSQITVRGGGTLLIDHSEAYMGAPGGRIHDSAPVTLVSSSLQLAGSATATTSETIGPLAISGASSVTLVPGGSSTLTAAALRREERGTILFRAPELGSAAAEGASRILFSAAPLAELAGGGGGGPQTSIIPFAIGDASPTGSGSGLVTYDATTGIRMLNEASDYAPSFASAEAGANVRLTTSTELSANTSINALVLGPGVTLGGAGRLTIGSGTLLSSTSGRITADVGFEVREANVFTPGTASLSIDGRISGAGGLTKSGAGTLSLTNANPLTGPLTINDGQVVFTSIDALGSKSSPIHFNTRSSTLGLNYTGTSPLAFDRDIHVIDGFAPFRANQPVTISGAISGAGGFAGSGEQEIALTGANTYAGSTLVQGPIAITGDSSLGNGGAVEFKGSQLRITGAWTSERQILLAGAGWIRADGNPITLNGPIQGSNQLTLINAPTVLAGASPFTGPIQHSGESLRLANGGRIQASSITTDGALILDNSSMALDRLAPGSVVSAGTLSLLGNSSVDVLERVGTIIARRHIELTAPGPFGTVLRAGSYFNPTSSITQIRGDNLGGAAGSGFSRLVFDNDLQLKGGIVPNTFIIDPATGAIDSLAYYDRSSDSAGAVGMRSLRETDLTRGSVHNPANGGSTAPDANMLIAGEVRAVGENNVVNTLTLDGNSSLTLTAAQALTLGSSLALSRSGSNSLIEGGKLILGATGVLVNSGNLTIRSGIEATSLRTHGSGTLTLGGTSFAGFLNIADGTVRLERGALPTNFARLSVSRGATLDLDDAEIIVGNGFSEIQGSISGRSASSFTKEGTETLTVANMSQAAGALIVSNGTLALEGQLASGTPALVKTGAVLTGNGDIRREVHIEGTLRPGSGIGTLNTGNLTFFPFSTLALEIGAAGHDRVNIAGALRFDGPTNLTLSLSYQPAPGQSFLVMSNDGVEPVDHDPFWRMLNFAGQPLYEGSRFTASKTEFGISYSGGDGNDIVLYVIPEPSAAGLLMAASALLLARRRRHRVHH